MPHSPLSPAPSSLPACPDFFVSLVERIPINFVTAPRQRVKASREALRKSVQQDFALLSNHFSFRHSCGKYRETRTSMSIDRATTTRTFRLRYYREMPHSLSFSLSPSPPSHLSFPSCCIVSRYLDPLALPCLTAQSNNVYCSI